MGRLLGIKGNGKNDLNGAFLPIVAEVVIEMSAAVDPDVKKNANRICEELRREELRFVQTLERGEKLLEELLQEALAQSDGKVDTKPVISGKNVFILYDTFGFPVEITEEVATERGVVVDMEGFEAEMEIQRRQSQAAHNTVKLYADDVMAEISSKLAQTEFLGYSSLESSTSVVALLSKGLPVTQAFEGDEVEVILDKTPFYAESGGQIGDHGSLIVEGTGAINVTDVQKAGGGLFLHKGTVEEGSIQVGIAIDAKVDMGLRRRCQVLSLSLSLYVICIISQSLSLIIYCLALNLRYLLSFSRSRCKSYLLLTFVILVLFLELQVTFFTQTLHVMISMYLLDHLIYGFIDICPFIGLLIRKLLSCLDEPTYIDLGTCSVPM
jgi:hypothetical protein